MGTPNGERRLTLVQGHDGNGRPTYDQAGRPLLIEPSQQRRYRPPAEVALWAILAALVVIGVLVAVV